ncbi:MAG TPA: FHA domain-containing protein [Actinomycetota bacterium]|nr:FHA domain-containing protein [Actinomycetota bacterium]
MYCHNCGHRNPQGSNFCSTCGAALQPDEQADTTITFTPEKEAEASQEFQVTIGELEGGKAILIVRKGPDAGAKFTIDKDVITCGRHPGSDIFLDDVTVSRKHAEIRRDDSGYRIADVGSLNGTFVNRERAEGIPLNNGDEIQIGKFRLVFFTEATT